MRPSPVLLLLPLLAPLGGCTAWPPPGTGGMAELQAARGELPAPANPALQARLDCGLARLDAVAAAAEGSHLLTGRVALARQTAARARREQQGGLSQDAARSLEQLETETGAIRLALPPGALAAGALPDCR